MRTFCCQQTCALILKLEMQQNCLQSGPKWGSLVYDASPDLGWGHPLLIPPSTPSASRSRRLQLLASYPLSPYKFLDMPIHATRSVKKILGTPLDCMKWTYNNVHFCHCSVQDDLVKFVY